MKSGLITVLVVLSTSCFAQFYPHFGSEIKVNITGMSFDAMEPFISSDGNTLFFNSLNSGGNTNLYYANKVDDTTFTFEGLVEGTYDPTPDHLDAVASLDSLNNFFWVSLRGYPVPMENLHCGKYDDGVVSDCTRVYGDFNRYEFAYPFGWLIMDAAIDYSGEFLYFCNAKFDFLGLTCAGIPCESKIGLAAKENDSTFNKLPSSEATFALINDTANYIIYAPQVTKDGLEIYFTRLLKGSFNTEICVSVRNSVEEPFSAPLVLHSNLGFVPEAASPTLDKQKIYYHQKDETGIFHIYLRNRIVVASDPDFFDSDMLQIYPNPTNGMLEINLPYPNESFTCQVHDAFGKEIYTITDNTSIDLSLFSNGIYFLSVIQNDKKWVTKIIKE